MEKLIIISIFSFIFTFFGTKLLKDFFIKKKYMTTQIKEVVIQSLFQQVGV